MISRRVFARYMQGVAGLAVFPDLITSDALAGFHRQGYWVPEEALPHQRTFMQWPVNRDVHPDAVFLEMLQHSIAEIANTISQFESVIMLIDARYKMNATRKLSSAVEIWDVPTDDLWCRDSGPVFVRNRAGNLAVSHLNFNGWGNKQVHTNDAKIANRIAERLELPVFDNGLVGEAGGVDTDGAGTLIAHESSWVNDNRNRRSKADIEALMLAAIGAEKLIWAPGVKGADITDYHIDSLARFTEPGTVLIQLPERQNENDTWSTVAFEIYKILKKSVDVEGRNINLVVIPEPVDTRVTSPDFVASYVNYYVCNGGVIAARFGDEAADEQARSVLKRLYPEREVITLNVDPIGETGGGIHCTTQQQPMV